MPSKVCGAEKRRKRNTEKSPDCWTHELKLKPLQNFTDEELYQRDNKSDYTVVHAVCASGMDRETLECQFQILGDKKQLGKVVAKNRKGNVPLQSAIESKAAVQTIEVILNYVPGTKKIMIKNRNKYNETALEQSLVLEHPDVFKLLLKECISCGALEDLTCIGKANRRCSTVVHQCIRNRRIAHFRAFMEVCKESNVKGNLCALNKKGYTPWEYLMRYKKEEMPLVKEVFSILDVHGVAVGSLTDNTNEETMLHRAYRTNNVEFKVLLEGKYEITCDGRKRKPLDRSRTISNQELAPKTTTQSLPKKTKPSDMLSPCQLPENKTPQPREYKTPQPLEYKPPQLPENKIPQPQEYQPPDEKTKPSDVLSLFHPQQDKKNGLHRTKPSSHQKSLVTCCPHASHNKEECNLPMCNYEFEILHLQMTLIVNISRQ